MKKYYFILIIIIFLFLVGSLILSLNSIRARSSESENGGSVQEYNDITTADWKIYRNDTYGFELKVPVNFYIDYDRPYGGTLALANWFIYPNISTNSFDFWDIYFTVAENPQYKSGYEFMKQYKPPSSLNPVKKIINGLEAGQTTEVGVNRKEITTFFASGEYAYIIQGRVAPSSLPSNITRTALNEKVYENEKMYNQILNTFKLL